MESLKELIEQSGFTIEEFSNLVEMNPAFIEAFIEAENDGTVEPPILLKRYAEALAKLRRASIEINVLKLEYLQLTYPVISLSKDRMN